MAWVFRNNWPWTLLAFGIGAIITWILLNRRPPAPPEQEETVEEKTLVTAGVTASGTTSAPTPKAEPVATESAFSQRMDAGEPTLFDDVEPAANEVQVKSAAVPPGRYGEGSADAVAHQGPPDGFTIKGNVQSMLFHTPDSPYYGRTKPEVWFRTEADAERAGFTKYARKPRKSTRPAD